MAHDKSLIALIDLPTGHAQQVLRAGLMAMNVIPTPISGKSRARVEALSAMVAQTRAVAFIDISNNSPSLMELDRLLPNGGWRERIFLTRLCKGHVSEGDRRWVKKLGFGGLWSDFDARDMDGDLAEAIHATAFALDHQPPSPQELKRYANSAGAQAANTAREVIRGATGLKAEALVVLLARQLAIQERHHHLTVYPSCFVGREAVAKLVQQFNCDAVAAVAVGDALAQLGLLVHVVQEKPFEDAGYFYRLTTSTKVDRVNLGEALHVMRRQGGVPVDSRSYLGRDYPLCWVGAESIDFLANHFALKRHQAWILGHRLMQFGAFEHVAKEKPFIDGHFFYRFADDVAKVKAMNTAAAADASKSSMPVAIASATKLAR